MLIEQETQQRTAQRAERAAKYTTWYLELYGQRIPVDCDEGHAVWVTVIPLCPACLEPVDDDRRLRRHNPETDYVACSACLTHLGTLERTRQAPRT